jgi:UDP-glucose 6-dehydrogenase
MMALVFFHRLQPTLKLAAAFGGSCFPKDVKALISYGKQKGNPMATS